MTSIITVASAKQKMKSRNLERMKENGEKNKNKKTQNEYIIC